MRYINVYTNDYVWCVRETHYEFFTKYLIGNEDKFLAGLKKGIILKENKRRKTIITTIRNNKIVVKISLLDNSFLDKVKYRLKLSRDFREFGNTLKYFPESDLQMLAFVYKKPGNKHHLISEGKNSIDSESKEQVTSLASKAKSHSLRETKNVNPVSILFIKHLDNYRSLYELITNNELSANQLQEIFSKTNELLFNLKSQCLLHLDLHIGNIMVHQPDLNLCPIDTSGIVRLPGFLQFLCEQNFYRLAYSFSKHLPFSKFYRFVEMYVRQSTPTFNLREIRRQLEKIRKFEIKKLYDRANKVFKNSTNYKVFKHKELKGYLIQGVEMKTAKEITEKVKAIINTNYEQFILKKRDGFSYVVRVQTKEKKYIVKVLTYSNLWQVLRYKWKLRQLEHAWSNSYLLTLKRITIPQFVGLVFEKDKQKPANFGEWNIFYNHFYLISEEIENGKNLPEFIRYLVNEKSDNLPNELRDSIPTRKKCLVKALAYFIRNIHRQGIYHKDLKANNIIVRIVENNQPKSFPSDDIMQFYLIDIDRIKLKTRLKEKDIIHNLAQLNASLSRELVSNTERLRFLYLYNPRLRYFDTKKKKKIIRRIVKQSIARKHFWP